MMFHPDHHPPGLRELAGSWSWDPVVAASLVAGAALYVAGVRALWIHAGRGHGIRRREVAAFAAGLLSVVVALISPLDFASDVLFSAHMSQHTILMLVSAPLLVLGRPLLAYLWVLPRRGRDRVAAGLRRPGFSAFWRGLTRPFVVLLLQAAVLWIWHVPALFEAALENEGVHAVQHLLFFLSASLFWWSLFHGRYGRAGYGVGVAYVFATAVSSSVLGAALGLAGHPWYAHHAERTREWGMAPVRDQQLAGLIMWVPAGMLLAIIGLALFGAWLGEAGRRAARAERSTWHES